MEHWFESATKSLATGGLSRRDALTKIALAGLASLVPGSSWAQRLFQQRPGAALSLNKPSRFTATGPNVSRLSASTTHKGQGLTLESVWSMNGQHTAFGTFFMRVELGGRLVREVTLTQVPATQKGRRTEKSSPGASQSRLEVFNGSSIRGPRHVIVRQIAGTIKAIADGKPVNTPNLTGLNQYVDEQLHNSVRVLAGNAHENLSIGNSRARRVVDNGACDNCVNDCTDKAKNCSVDAFTDLDPIALFGCAGHWMDCMNNCNNPGGPCCSVSCNNGQICCAVGQTCCGGTAGTPPTCCDAGAVCISGIFDGVTQYSYCCPAGSDPAGCQYTDDGININMYCRAPGQTCCGYEGVCNSGQTCINPQWGLCCPNGQPLCSGSFACCDGACITYNAGTSAQNQACCAHPNVIWGDARSGVNPVCCPPQSCRTSSRGQKICCDQPLCGDVCCVGSGVCHDGKCGVGEPCGSSFCGFGEPCCGGKCCPAGSTCLNGKCCPQLQSCGTVCCSSGQFCSEGRCMSGCPNGMDIARAPDGSEICCPLYQCNNPSDDNICLQAACPGLCCGPNKVCCPTELPGHYTCSFAPCPPTAQ